MKESVFYKLGFSENEREIYMALLTIGSGSVTRLARESGLSRTTSYSVLESLEEKGLASRFEYKGKLHFASEHPKQLLKLLSDQEDVLWTQKEALENLLPELSALFGEDKREIGVRMCSGMSDFFDGLNVLLDAQPDDSTIYAIFPMDFIKEEVPATLVRPYSNKRSKKKILTRTFVVTKKPNVFWDQKKESLLRESVLLNEEGLSFPADLTIYDDGIASASLSRELLGVTIFDRDIAETMFRIFSFLWEGSEKK